MDKVELRYTKWDGKLHWHFDLDYLGEDEHGLWLGAPRGCVMQRGNEPAVTAPVGFAVLTPRDGCWTAYFNSPTDTEMLQLSPTKAVEIYIDVTDKPKRTEDGVEAIDLDLDVIRWGDGRVTLEDEDEFLEHQTKYAYPQEVIERAEETAQHLLQVVQARDEPFGAAAAPWISRLKA
ncbi:MAG TPA: DUF402 domain-containing protein [Acidimicrobiales bacterium]|nr:DUF402 domain-containing protein [Acidimicrobiales bacterium]